MAEPRELLGPFKGPKVKRPEKLSQSALARFNVCPFSAALYLKHKGGYQSPEMARGEIFHQFVEQAIEYMRDEDEKQMPPEVAKDRIMALIAERTDLHLPEHEMNACRAMAWNWGRATVVDPEQVVGLEQMIELEVGNWTVRGKLDFAEIGPFGAVVRDYKTQINRPSQDEVERGAKSYQGRFYALLLLFGIPEGESLPLGKGLNECRVELVFPRFVNEDTGELLDRVVTWSRDELADFRTSLEIHLTEFEEGLETGEWKAQTGAHCNECAARDECPLPDRVHPVPYVETHDEAVSNALAWHLGSRELEPVKAGVKDYCDRNGLELLRYDADYALAYVPETKHLIDWDAVGNGPVATDQITVTNGAKFIKRKLKPEEKEALDG